MYVFIQYVFIYQYIHIIYGPMRPGPTGERVAEGRVQGTVGPGPKRAQGPSGPRAQVGPGPKWAAIMCMSVNVGTIGSVCHLSGVTLNLVNAVTN